ncbi:MAG: hypothetical protein ACXVI8_07780 [Halobacteriota archaeon]
MAPRPTSVALRFWITVIILAIVLFVFEDALIELALGAGKEQGIVIGPLGVLTALTLSFFIVRRAFQIAKEREYE